MYVVCRRIRMLSASKVNFVFGEHDIFYLYICVWRQTFWSRQTLCRLSHISSKRPWNECNIWYFMTDAVVLHANPFGIRWAYSIRTEMHSASEQASERTSESSWGTATTTMAAGGKCDKRGWNSKITSHHLFSHCIVITCYGHLISTKQEYTAYNIGKRERGKIVRKDSLLRRKKIK